MWDSVWNVLIRVRSRRFSNQISGKSDKMRISGNIGVWSFFTLSLFCYSCASQDDHDCAAQEHERLQELEKEVASTRRLLGNAVRELQRLEEQTYAWTQGFLQTGIYMQICGAPAIPIIKFSFYYLTFLFCLLFGFCFLVVFFVLFVQNCCCCFCW